MTTMPQKVQGPWKQGIYDISATATEIVGTIRKDAFGRKFAYAKAGAAELSPSKMTVTPALNADWVNESVTAAVAVGGKVVTITHVAVGADALAADYFAGGLLQINDEAGEGHSYRILSSTAMVSDSTTCTFTLEEGIKVALTTSSEATPIPSPYMATVVAPASDTKQCPAGVPLVTVTAAYYYWSQIGGMGMYLSAADVASAGAFLSFDSAGTGGVAGALGATVLAHATTTSADFTNVIIAVNGPTAGVSGEYKPCRYIIPE